MGPIPKKPIREKPHRLPEAAYLGRKCVSFTACEDLRRPLLACKEVHEAFRDILSESAERFRCSVPIYCLMPDHLHALILGLGDDSRPKMAMERFKRRSGEWMAIERPELRWQKDFHDHIVRAKEGYEVKARYIALNPVRAGLASDVYGYPFTGSIGYTLREIVEDAWW